MLAHVLELVFVRCMLHQDCNVICTVLPRLDEWKSWYVSLTTDHASSILAMNFAFIQDGDREFFIYICS
jgi:hypothetical protein